MLLERIPYIVDILAVVIVCHWCWTWYCCKKAKATYEAVDHLYDWGADIAALLKLVGECSGCGDTDPTWPPKDPGDFPEDFE